MPTEQKAKQLGADRFKVLQLALLRPHERGHGAGLGRAVRQPCAGGTIAHAPSIWRAMASGQPYRVRAFIADGNNTLMAPQHKGHLGAHQPGPVCVVIDFS